MEPSLKDECETSRGTDERLSTSETAQAVLPCSSTPNMGVILWGECPLYSVPVFCTGVMIPNGSLVKNSARRGQPWGGDKPWGLAADEFLDPWTRVHGYILPSRWDSTYAAQPRAPHCGFGSQVWSLTSSRPSNHRQQERQPSAGGGE